MTQRERLIYLIDSTPKGEDKRKKVTAEQIAEYLIENGVVVLPCPIGTKVWIVNKTYGAIKEGKFQLDDYNRIGSRVFLTREKAERFLLGKKR